MHESVLKNESISALNIVPNGCYVDATFGRGGHSRAILDALDSAGRLLVLDRDPRAFIDGDPLVLSDARVTAVPAAFDSIHEQVQAWGALGAVHGVLFDLGVSSPQLDDAARGFSFMRSGPLDMRMDPHKGQPLSVLLRTVSEKKLADIIHHYGEERYARRIAHHIFTAYHQQQITTTGELAEVIKAAHPAWVKGQHPATRTFQALRIWVNDEAEQIQRALSQLSGVLAPGGRVVVIAFHSLEDAWVKSWGAQCVRDPRYPPNLPIQDAYLQPPFKVCLRLVRPGADEIARNPRARSARLRAWEKC